MNQRLPIAKNTASGREAPRQRIKDTGQAFRANRAPLTGRYCAKFDHRQTLGTVKADLPPSTITKTCCERSFCSG